MSNTTHLFRRALFLPILACSILAGCDDASSPNTIPDDVKEAAKATNPAPVITIDKAKAIELAQKELYNEGEKLADYDMNVHDDSVGGQWFVSFNKKSSGGTTKTFGGDFEASIDKKTGKVIFRAND